MDFIESCIPTQTASPPVGAQWIHEIKHDGYRLMVPPRRARAPVHASGYDWTERYPLIRAAAEKFAIDPTIDGAAVDCNVTGVADFEQLHSRDNDGAAFLYAFDLLDANGAIYGCCPSSGARTICASCCNAARSGSTSTTR